MYNDQNIYKTLNEFAPERVIEVTDPPKSASWVTNKIKNVIVKRDEMFQKRIAEPAIENQTRYKQTRYKVTNLIRNRKRDNNVKRFGKNTNPKMIYRTIKTRKKVNAIDLPKFDDMNYYFVSIGPKLSEKFNNKESSYIIRNNKKNDCTSSNI